MLQVVSDITGVPLHQLTAQALASLAGLEESLGASVFGQTNALQVCQSTMQMACTSTCLHACDHMQAVASALRLWKLGLSSGGGAAASFLLCGPSGVGKTTLCQVGAAGLPSFSKDSMQHHLRPHSWCIYGLSMSL